MRITPEQYKIAEKNGIDKKNVDQRALYGTWSIERAITESLNTEMIDTEKEFFGGAG